VRAKLRLRKALRGTLIDFRLGERVDNGESKALNGSENWF